MATPATRRAAMNWPRLWGRDVATEDKRKDNRREQQNDLPAEAVAQCAGNRRADRAAGEQAAGGNFGLEFRPMKLAAQEDNRAIDDGDIEAKEKAAQRRDRRDAVRVATALRFHTPTSLRARATAEPALSL